MKHKIYTIGKMKGLDLKEQMDWRLQLEKEVNNMYDSNIVTFVNPPVFYNYLAPDFQKSEKEVKEWELNQLRDCDIAVVKLDGINDSIGSHFELGFIDAVNQLTDRHIYVIGIGRTNGVYPWIKESLFRVEPDIQQAAQYIKTYLIF